MIQQMASRFLEKNSRISASYWCLLAIGIVDFLIICLGPYMTFYLDELLLIPSALYVFIIMKQEKTKTAKRVLLLGVIMCVWFVITQFIHHCMGLQTRPVGMFFSVYLLAFSFATLEADGNRGLKLYISVFLAGIAVALILVGLLMLGKIPSFLRPKVYFWKLGLIVMIHPSQFAGFLLTGIAFSLAAMSIAKHVAHRILLLVLVVLGVFVLAMTKNNAAIWMVSLLLGIVCFLAISRGGVLRFLAGLAAGVIVFGCTYSVSQSTVKWYDYKSGYRKVRSEQMMTERMAYSGRYHEPLLSPTKLDQMIASISVVSSNPDTGNLMRAAKSERKEEPKESKEPERFSLRNTLDKLLPKLNGRKGIWLAVYDVLKKDPVTLAIGTDYSGNYIVNNTEKDFPHAHNSWLDVLVALGLPGLLLVSLFTIIAFWHIFLILFGKEYELWQKCVALLAVCLMAVGAMEPHLFLGGHYLAERNSLHPSDFTFFLCLSYMIQWRAAKKEAKSKPIGETITMECEQTEEN